MCGGGPGARGANLLTLGGAGADTRTISLGGKNTVHVARGDRLTILTPGGGGWGAPASSAALGNSGSDSGSDIGSGIGGSAGARQHGAAVPVRTSGSLHQYAMTQESA